MSKRPFKASASSGRVVPGFGGFGLATTASSSLSYVQEPLDFTTISDSHAVVVLKNLQKRDDTTKTKALDDLQALVDAADVLEDGILEAWVRLFPRLSIDNNRRVRQLSLITNGKICTKAGKRIAKHMPQLAGSWLASLYDSDRAVVKSAQEALSLVFPDPEKLSAVRRVYQQAVLDYCKNAILNETLSTLSDERVVSKDDAASTFARVIASSLALLATTISRSGPEDILKHTTTYLEIFDSKALEYTVHADPSVRRATHTLVRSAVVNLEDIISQKLQTISKIYIYKGLQSDQIGSSTDYVTTLVLLTQHYPTIWTDEYTGKKSAVSRLAHFLKQGSQAAPAEFWNQLAQLFSSIPIVVIQDSSSDIDHLLTAMRDGVTRREERSNATVAWEAYVVLQQALFKSSQDNAGALVEQHLDAFLQRWIFVGEDSIQGISANTAGLVVSALSDVPAFTGALSSVVERISSKLVETMRVSLPEQSKDYKTSQTQLSQAGDRWALLQRTLFSDNNLDGSIRTKLIVEDSKLLWEAIQLIQSRCGKPWGAAAIVSSLLQSNGDFLVQEDAVKQTLLSFVEHDLGAVLFSASSTSLLQCLTALHKHTRFDDLLVKTIQAIIGADEPLQAKIALLSKLAQEKLPEHVTTTFAQNQPLQELVMQAATMQDDLVYIYGLWTRGLIARDTQDALINRIVTNLNTDTDVARSLGQINGLQVYVRNRLLEYDTSAASNERLLPAILRQSESENEQISKLATDLMAKLSFGDSTGAFATIKQSLADTGSNSSSIEALVGYATRLLEPAYDLRNILSCLPDLVQYRKDIVATLLPPAASLSISHPFGTAIYRVAPEKHGLQEYDTSGYSKVLRTAAFTIELLSHSDLATLTSTNSERAINNLLFDYFTLSCAVIIAAKDKAHVAMTNDIWLDNPATEAAVLSDVGQMQSTMRALVNGLGHNRLIAILDAASPDSQESIATPLAYYLALVRLRLSASAKDRLELDVVDSAKLYLQQAAREPFTAAADLTTQVGNYAYRAQSLKLANELVATLTGLDFVAKSLETERCLIALNILLASDNDFTNDIPKQRVIFLVKHLLTALADTDSHSIGEEGLRTLGLLLPGIADIYGEHWSQASQIVLDTWTSLGSVQRQREHVPTLYHTLRLYAALRKLLSLEDVNEDLQEVFTEKADAFNSALVALLRTAGESSDVADQPLAMTNELLARQIASSPSKPRIDNASLLPILSTPSLYIQEAAFALMHDQIPALQEQVSLDAALDNKTARLPDELLSMLLEAPSAADYREEAFERSVPASLQTYLNSWRLLFAYFNGSSYKVKSDYSDQLKEGTYLSRLLSLTFDLLGHVKSKPVDVTGYDIERYEAGIEQDPVKDTRWLLTHLYYFSLLHLPSLVKLYVLDLRSRQTPAVIEEWTAKYVSPAIILSSLQGVSEWSEKTVKEDPEYENVTVKVGLRSKEVNVSYIVDEQTMAIKITLPDAYPLAPALVDGVSRVAVKEVQWQSWLRNCQGVITFSNGSITDGLAAWRRNVTGALKGQTECAICYSIISADKQLPTKKCPTCKNLFHSSCLFKWFKTSNASTCPLCRNSFNFN